ncbi:hypothetical protein IMSAGC013_02181 [Lachnospiraceae bacterium]|nr:hypothetical protein IMSAGC013_02181 [Lachnospiraceae bacterium]
MAMPALMLSKVLPSWGITTTITIARTASTPTRDKTRLTGRAGFPPLGNNFCSMAVMGMFRINAIAKPKIKGNRIPHKKARNDHTFPIFISNANKTSVNVMIPSIFFMLFLLKSILSSFRYDIIGITPAVKYRSRQNSAREAVAIFSRRSNMYHTTGRMVSATH